MHIIYNTDFILEDERISNFELNVFKIWQTFWCHMETADEGACYLNKNWYINRLKEELYLIWILWKEEYIDLTLVLTEIEQKTIFIRLPYDQKRYMNLKKK